MSSLSGDITFSLAAEEKIQTSLVYMSSKLVSGTTFLEFRCIEVAFLIEAQKDSVQLREIPPAKCPDEGMDARSQLVAG